MTWTLSTLNVNGLRACVRKGFPKWRARSGVDVFCLQEVRMWPDQMGKEHLPPRGWKAVHAVADKKGYSGASVWSRRPVQSQSVGCGLDWADAEGRVARMDLDVATVVSVYLPSGSSGDARQARKEAFMDHFARFSEQLLAEGRPVVLCGDLNIAHTELDIKNARSNQKNSGFLPHEREWFSRLLDLGWVDVWRSLNPGVEEYSWWSQRGAARDKNVGWRLDYQLASPDLAARAEKAWIVGRKPNLSDHCPVNVTYRI